MAPKAWAPRNRVFGGGPLLSTQERKLNKHCTYRAGGGRDYEGYSQDLKNSRLITAVMTSGNASMGPR